MKSLTFKGAAGLALLLTVSTLTPTVAFGQYGYGGGGGGGRVINREPREQVTLPTPDVAPVATSSSTTTPTTGGQVLGAERFIFTSNLFQGLSNNDVVELQKRLRVEGHFSYPTDTGYFGPITRAAVVAFQSDNGVPATGFVGPLTRAALNELAPVAATSATDEATTTEEVATSTDMSLKGIVDMLIALAIIPAEKVQNALSALALFGE